MRFFHFGHGWQRAVNGFARGVVRYDFVGHRPLEHCTHSLPYAAGILGNLSPDRSQNPEDVLLPDLVNWGISDDGESMTFKSLKP